jgi:large subunit ribosomal protein L44e
MRFSIAMRWYAPVLNASVPRRSVLTRPETARFLTADVKLTAIMEMPRRMNTYCPHCNAHQEHEVEKVRRGRETGMKWIDRQRKRGLSTVGNAGKFSKVPGGDKPTKKTNLKYRCGECGKAHMREGWRAGRLKFQE